MIFDLEKKHTSHSLKAREKGRRSPSKKISPRGKRKLSFQSKKTDLLKGRKFFLDIQGIAKGESIKQIILQLGGAVEEFNSKDVYCIVTNRASLDEIVSYRNQYRSSTPSPLSGLAPSPQCAPTPSPLQQISSNKCMVNSPLSTDSPQAQQSLDNRGITITRGKSLLNKAVSSTQKQGSSNLLQLAQKFGTKVLHLEHFLKWTKEKKVTECLQAEAGKRSTVTSSTHHSKSSSFRVKKLKSPFIKVESQTRKYRPFFIELEEWPVICTDSAPGTCPFDKPKVNDLHSERKSHVFDKETNKDEATQPIDDKSSEKDPQKGPEVKDTKKNVRDSTYGYCECCSVRYNDLAKHLKSEQHLNFARNDANYACLDSTIERGKTIEEFLEIIRHKYEDTSDQSQQMSCTIIDESSHVQESPYNNTYLHYNSCNENHQEMNEITFSEKENRPFESVTIQSMVAEGTNLLGNVSKCQLSETEIACVEVASKTSELTCSEKDDGSCTKRLAEVRDSDLNVKHLASAASAAPNTNAHELEDFQTNNPITREILENTTNNNCPSSENSTRIEDTLFESTLINAKVDTRLLEPCPKDGATPGISGAVDMTPISTVQRPSDFKVVEKPYELTSEIDEEAVPRRKRVLRSRKDSHIRQDSKVRLAERGILETCTNSLQSMKSAARQVPIVGSSSNGKRILRRSVRRSSRPSSYKEGLT